jgi:CDP-glycerol glycerophosphotransferase (TagB/SpsB family)
VKIVYVTFRGHFSDSPRALYRAIRERGIDAEHTWLSAEHTQRTFPADVQTITFGSPESIEALEAADLVISNDHIPLDWDKRPGATYLQTWHGTMLKRIHRDVLWAPEGRLDYLEHDIARWDLLLSPNPVTTPRLRRAFGYQGPVHETGLPRNDVLNSPGKDDVRARVRHELGIPDGTTAVLYTPTWRDDLVFEGTAGRDFDFPIDVDDFTDRLGEDHVLLLRLHNMVTGRLADTGTVRDVSPWADIADLYLAADLMVTDYSSTMFDFAVTGKPLLFLTYDLDDYRDRLRGFYFDLAEVAPGPLIATGKELLTAVADVDSITAAYADRYADFRRTFCALDDGHATERVLDLLFASGGATAGPTEPERG